MMSNAAIVVGGTMAANSFLSVLYVVSVVELECFFVSGGGSLPNTPLYCSCQGID